VPITGRCAAVSKSPLTNLYIDSAIGGHLGPELKRAGFDMLVIQGCAEKPVWLLVSPNETAIQDASHLWGKTTHEVELRLRKQDPRTCVLSTGPAGERLVRFASLTHDYFRSFGRGGLGAVFGAKRLKAITVRGTDEVIATPDRDRETALVKQLAQRARTAKLHDHQLYVHGTPWLIEFANTAGMCPTRNFQTTYFKEYARIAPQALENCVDRQLRRTPCEGCVISCTWSITKPFPWAPAGITGKVALPEYETVVMMGANLGISDPLTITQANHLCNTLGLDTITTGSVIGLLMELNQRQLLPEAEARQALRFGDAQGLTQLILKIAQRAGLGDALAEGAKRFAARYGAQAAPLAMHVKGLEFAAWDPRGKLGLGLSYATAAAGASHLRGWPNTEEVPRTSAHPIVPSLVEAQDLKILKDSLVICHFTHSIEPALSIEDCVELYSTVTGEQASVKSLREAAARIWLLKRLFNMREFDQDPRAYDELPPRLMTEPVPDGPAKGLTAFVTPHDFDKCLTELYRLRGCDAKGRPRPASLRRLGLASPLRRR
jgi:aldehyde:ferredoxin oxidoreductase